MRITKTTDRVREHLSKALGRLARQPVLQDKRGVAAVEFALIVPLMLAMYLGTMEMSAGVVVNKKVSRVASTVADLVTQQQEVSKADLEQIMGIGEAVLFPYVSRRPDIVVIGIDVDTSYPKGGKVVWSRRYDQGTFKPGWAKGSDVDVPAKLQINDTFLVRVDTRIDYAPVVSWLIGDTVGSIKNGVGVIEMAESYILRPRYGADITCIDC
ncbi:TadE/TadG family type IV pilus assembly protein [Oricola cellulosilytica]|uniref:Pilus assembly protein n=1 Tax=Oricola cellulosilytica TaxID=1429082 RepID=A0A4R0PIR3_9HYPH|nr:TadE/TadG family type IV pilus assembly protein [Oricola cellulosilytica]TCD16370.1 pilus assembly protein [Oricola cellulosilytica]